MPLTKSEILARSLLKTEEVEVPEWGGHVLVRELTAAERDEYEAEMFKASQVGGELKVEPNLRGARIRLAMYAMVDSEGNRLFSDDEFDEVAKLPASIIARIAEKAEQLSGLSATAREEMKASFTAAQGESSRSD